MAYEMTVMAMVYLIMGDRETFQPLTTSDRVTVVLYRTGIVLTSACLCLLSYLLFASVKTADAAQIRILSGNAQVLFICLYVSTALSVFFIHLYIGKFKRFLTGIYIFAFVGLIYLAGVGRGNTLLPLAGNPPLNALCLMPLSLCIGFVTAKEAFCFRLIEGYLIAILMPALVFFYAVGLFNLRAAASGLAVMAVMHLFFTVRKAFMPIHYDIGDKSAYQP